jgi:hypothetical protein
MKKKIQKTPVIRYEDEYPVILVEAAPVPRGSGIKEPYQVRFWCEHCGKYHLHGWRDRTTHPGHRNAHCSVNSPFYRTGYILEWLKLEGSNE